MLTLLYRQKALPVAFKPVYSSLSQNFSLNSGDLYGPIFPHATISIFHNVKTLSEVKKMGE